MFKKIFVFMILAFVIAIVIYFASIYDNKTNDRSSDIQKNIMSQIGETNFISSNNIINNNAQFTDEVAYFSTNVFGDSNRLENIRLSCNVINGAVINSGETFSFNDIVGKPTEDKGYKEADVIIGTKTEKGFGGGNCQVSTTLYNACLSVPDIEIIERHPHKKKVAYIEEGKDASVSFGVLDLKFKNNTSYPIKINMELTSSEVIARILR